VSDQPQPFKQVDVSAELILMSKAIADVPEPWATILRERYVALSDSILQHFASVIERDKLLNTLVEQNMVDTRYITFDLEATKRERDGLQLRLNNILGNDNDPELQE